MKFYRKEWSDEGWVRFLEIPSRPCTQADFDYEDHHSPDAIFYETQRTIYYLE